VAAILHRLTPLSFILLSISGVRSKAHTKMYGIKGAADPRKTLFFDKLFHDVVLSQVGDSYFLFFHLLLTFRESGSREYTPAGALDISLD
jgi:hypothetical protein